MVLDAFVSDVTFLAIVVAFVYYYYLPFQTKKTKTRKFASEINNNVLLYVKIYIVVEINVYVVQMICICNQKPRKYASEIDNIMFYYM